MTNLQFGNIKCAVLAILFSSFCSSVGGDASLPYVTTLPNILRKYNSDLYGFSVGTTSPLDTQPNTQLNVAMSGASTSRMPQQAEDLVRRIRESEEVDFDTDWKLVTVYIGGNDICKDACTGDSVGQPDMWVQSVAESLNYLRDNLPRTFVNLVQLPNIQEYQEKLANSSYGQECQYLFASITCPCGDYGQFSLGERFREIQAEFRQGIQSLADLYADSNTYTVVLQPYQMSVEFLEEDEDSVLSITAVDCVHLNAEGNRQFAVGLWNNMLERVGMKTRISRLPISEFNCPTEDQPFLFTAQNSSKCIAGGGKARKFSGPPSPCIPLLVWTETSTP
jgi:phospholipase B1